MQELKRTVAHFFVAAIILGARAANGGDFANPIHAGADPQAWVAGKTVWIYPTWSPRGREQFYAFSSTDLQHWQRHGPVLDLEKVGWVKDDGQPWHGAWAPGIIEKNGQYYFYYAVGPQNVTPSRIGVAVGDNPAGPFADSGKPLLTGGNGFEAIDPMVFTDPKSGKSYLYAGGSAGATLRVFELNADMVSFAREIPVATPTNFTEGAFMHYRNGIYYLSYSHGSWQDSTYSVHYATADSPTGPWTYRGAILTSDATHKGPGHHSFIINPLTGEWLIVYHRWENQTGDGPYHGARQICIDRVEYDVNGLILPIQMTDADAPPAKVPGVVIDHRPASAGIYIGSPSLAILPDGDYVASHDEFGPQSTSQKNAVTRIFRSRDRGQTWQPAAVVQGQFWSTLFVHRGTLYLIGTDKEYGNVVIRRSLDGGGTWTSPTNSACGLLRADGQYHCAPVPVIEHDGRLWRAMERRNPPTGWANHLTAGIFSAPADADLLNATNWLASQFLPGGRHWLDGNFRGWLEGNAVITPDGRIVDVLRVDTPGLPEKAAIVSVSTEGKTASFAPLTGFVALPGGAKKFTIRPDPRGGGYWTLANIVTNVPEISESKPAPGGIRNTLALLHSDDLRTWETRAILLHHPDVARHGFQYVDWQFDGDDLIAVCRTAYDDAQGGAHNYHDANFLTFHRVKNFRVLTPTAAR
jgi:hypothetical protein